VARHRIGDEKAALRGDQPTPDGDEQPFSH
jgi:hypothetical protein